MARVVVCGVILILTGAACGIVAMVLAVAMGMAP